MSNEGWVFGPMAIDVANATATSNNADGEQSNGASTSLVATAFVDNATVVRVGGAGTISGYAAFYDSAEFPGALLNIWSEGTGEAALAFVRLDDRSRWETTHLWLDALQEYDGSLQYVEVEDNTYGLMPYHSVVGAAWFLFAHLRGGIWGGDIRPFCCSQLPY